MARKRGRQSGRERWLTLISRATFTWHNSFCGRFQSEQLRETPDILRFPLQGTGLMSSHRTSEAKLLQFSLSSRTIEWCNQRATATAAGGCILFIFKEAPCIIRATEIVFVHRICGKVVAGPQQKQEQEHHSPVVDFHCTLAPPEGGFSTFICVFSLGRIAGWLTCRLTLLRSVHYIKQVCAINAAARGKASRRPKGLGIRCAGLEGNEPHTGKKSYGRGVIFF